MLNNPRLSGRPPVLVRTEAGMLNESLESRRLKAGRALLRLNIDVLKIGY
jgi:hypothetical protein